MSNVTPTERLAEDIRAHMARKRLSQVQLAELLGVSQVSVSRRLLGQTPIDVNELPIIAEFIGVPVSELLEGVVPRKASA